MKMINKIEFKLNKLFIKASFNSKCVQKNTHKLFFFIFCFNLPIYPIYTVINKKLFS